MRPFAGGFFATQDTAVYQLPRECEGWTDVKVGTVRAQLDLHTEWAVRENPVLGTWVLLIGTPIDIEGGSVSLSEVAQSIQSALDNGGPNAAIRYIAYLGGRFLAIFGKGKLSWTVPDCLATKSAFWDENNSSLTIASHAKLLAEVIGAEEDQVALEIMTSPDYSDSGGKYYPATLTPYASVRPLFANCMLRSDQGQFVKHERFYPWDDHVFCQSPVVAVRDFTRAFDKHVSLIAQIGRTQLSLTAGLDSRTALYGIRPFAEQDLSTYTYFRFETPTPDAVSDLLGASDLALALGLPHRILRLHPFDPSAEWLPQYSRTFPRGARFPALANCYAQHFDNDDVSVVSTGAEVGTGFYTERNELSISSNRLAQKFTYTSINQSPALVDAFDKYIRFTEFHQDRFPQYDYHDMFYWEHRNSKWANIWYSEIELSHRVLIPFNSRAVIEAMLSVPLEMRQGKHIQSEYVRAKVGAP